MGTSTHRQRHGLVPAILRVAGPMALAGGLLLTAAGLIAMVTAVASFEVPGAAWMLLIGLPLLAIGGVIVRGGYLRSTQRSLSRNVGPTLHNTLDYLGVAADPRDCPQCGRANAGQGRFCAQCGARLAAECRACGKLNGPSAHFCDRCRAPLIQHPLIR